jgi:transposase InsO family protein
MSAYQRQRRERQLVQNVSCKGNCHDNAAMESFFEVLKTEFFYLDKLDSTGPRPWLPRESLINSSAPGATGPAHLR